MHKNDLRKTILISCYGGLGESKRYINIFDLISFLTVMTNYALEHPIAGN